nr:MAG TPA: hypothetical protein [Caudoviricetes sp.]
MIPFFKKLLQLRSRRWVFESFVLGLLLIENKFEPEGRKTNLK